ncbi:MAG: DUF5121 domain-containing protein, partial [Bacteroidales bacterium]|nr:DUF5121 domain-containing protein [Bacteroidales bacterium]
MKKIYFESTFIRIKLLTLGSACKRSFLSLNRNFLRSDNTCRRSLPALLKRNVLFILAALSVLQVACRKEYKEPEQKGNPIITPVQMPQSGHFGDSLPFTVRVSDETPLSTLKVQLFFGETQVSETVIRTMENGDYSGKIFVPFFKNIPDGKATLRTILQNITTKKTVQDTSLPLTRPAFPNLTLITEDGDEYTMLPTENANEYSVTGAFPTKLKGYFKAPKTGSAGNEITFGWESGEVVENSISNISFSSITSNYTISFNTFSYAFAPAIELKVNGTDMIMLADGPYVIKEEQYAADLTLTSDNMLEFEGFSDWGDWWIDPDYFEEVSDNTLKFLAISGKYRIIANFYHQHISAEAMIGNDLATTQADGTGAVWIIGDGIGKPSVATNQTGWTTEKGLCMAPVGDKKYRITGVVGQTLSASINFKFFYQKGWGGEFTGSANTDGKGVITTASTLVTVGAGDGNIQTPAGQPLELFGIYTFTVDLSGGLDAAVLTVEKAGDVPPPAFEGEINGTPMETVDGNNFKAEIDLTQGGAVTITGISDIADYWFDPDYFNPDGSFAAITGKYRITANTALKYFRVEAMSGNDLATLQTDGTGAIWIIGDNIGKPSLESNYVGWNTDNGLCMAPLGNGVYRFTGTVGQQLKADALNFKFFHQRGWGGEFTGATITTTSNLVMIEDGGNIQLYGFVS